MIQAKRKIVTYQYHRYRLRCWLCHIKNACTHSCYIRRSIIHQLYYCLCDDKNKELKTFVKKVCEHKVS